MITKKQNETVYVVKHDKGFYEADVYRLVKCKVCTKTGRITRFGESYVREHEVNAVVKAALSFETFKDLLSWAKRLYGPEGVMHRLAEAGLE